MWWTEKNHPFLVPFSYSLIYFFQDEAWAWSLLALSAGTGLSPNSLFWLPSSRPAGCCFALSELPVAKRRTTVAISPLISKRRQELQNPAVLSIIHHRLTSAHCFTASFLSYLIGSLFFFFFVWLITKFFVNYTQFAFWFNFFPLRLQHKWTEASLQETWTLCQLSRLGLAGETKKAQLRLLTSNK